MVNFTKILEGVRDFADSEKPLDLLLIAVNETKADFTNRVFNSEQGTKDVKGKGLGNYSNSYAEYRKSLGRQTKFVDLELTGSLRRNLQLIRSNTSISMQFRDPLEVEKVLKLEKQYKKTIFELSTDEKNSVNTKANSLFIKEITQIINDGIGNK